MSECDGTHDTGVEADLRAEIARLRPVVEAARRLTETKGPWRGDGTPARLRAVDTLDEALAALARAEAGAPPKVSPEEERC